MKCKCSSDIFKISNRTDCSKCENNGAWSGEQGKYLYDHQEVLESGADRDQAENDGECTMGDSHNSGCYVFSCCSCGKLGHLPLYEH